MNFKSMTKNSVLFAHGQANSLEEYLAHLSDKGIVPVETYVQDCTGNWYYCRALTQKELREELPQFNGVSNA